MKVVQGLSASKCVPSVVLSSFHQDEDLVLKSSRIMVNKKMVEAVLLWSSSKSDRNFQIWYCLALGTCKQHTIFFTNLQGDFTYNSLT